MVNKDNFPIENFIINLLAIILMSILTIHKFWIGTIFILCIFAFLTVKVRLYYFGPPSKWPTSSFIKAILLPIIGYIYLMVLAGDLLAVGGRLVFLSVGDKYGLLASIVITYTVIFMFRYSSSNKKTV